MTDAVRVHPSTPPAADRAQAPAAPAHGDAGFRALLERLQQLAAPGAHEPVVRDADELRTAVEQADRSFTTAMDLRRQLEEAFRRHLP